MSATCDQTDTLWLLYSFTGRVVRFQYTWAYSKDRGF